MSRSSFNNIFKGWRCHYFLTYFMAGWYRSLELLRALARKGPAPAHFYSAPPGTGIV